MAALTEREERVMASFAAAWQERRARADSDGAFDPSTLFRSADWPTSTRDDYSAFTRVLRRLRDRGLVEQPRRGRYRRKRPGRRGAGGSEA